MSLPPARELLLGYVRKRIDHLEMAEDFLQDSLLQATRSSPDLRPAQLHGLLLTNRL